MKSVVFFGTDEFAVSILEALLDAKIPVLAIVTKPDRAKKRNKRVLPTPVKECAQKRCPEVPLFQPEKASTSEFAQTLRGFAPDLFVVVSYGEIISEDLLSIPKISPVNIHPSFLPKYRGASPLRSALLAGDKEIGVAIIEMVKAMDAGDIIALEKIEVENGENHSDIQKRVFALSQKMIVKLVKACDDAEPKKVRQEGEPTFTKKIKTEDGLINWSEDVHVIYNKIAAFGESPGAYCFVKTGDQSSRLKILKAKLISDDSNYDVNTKTFSKSEGWIVNCKGGSLQILQVQKENKKLMEVQDFINGARGQAPVIVLK